MSSATQWTFFTNHAHVLLYLTRNPDEPLREVAHAVGITERAVQRIVADLEQAGYLLREREGRKNHYTINLDQPLRHPLEEHCTLKQVLGPLLREIDDRIKVLTQADLKSGNGHPPARESVTLDFPRNRREG